MVTSNQMRNPEDLISPRDTKLRVQPRFSLKYLYVSQHDQHHSTPPVHEQAFQILSLRPFSNISKCHGLLIRIFPCQFGAFKFPRTANFIRFLVMLRLHARTSNHQSAVECCGEALHPPRGTKTVNCFASTSPFLSLLFCIIIQVFIAILLTRRSLSKLRGLVQYLYLCDCGYVPAAISYLPTAASDTVKNQQLRQSLTIRLHHHK